MNSRYVHKSIALASSVLLLQLAVGGPWIIYELLLFAAADSCCMREYDEGILGRIL